MATSSTNAAKRRRGFTRAGALVRSRVKTASESRGFAQSRVLIHWAEIVGPDVAARARPVEVSYGQGFGATLELLTTGPNAPILEMQKDAIREKVNACYGYAAISRVRITQTAPTGFSDGQVSFRHREASTETPTPTVSPEVRKMATGVHDDDLRGALERLGANIASRKRD